jgi:hypothetical protein
MSSNLAAGTNDDAGCIAGKPPRPMSLAQNEETCAAQGLSLCEESCSGGGCSYNPYYVWTSIQCSGAPVSTPVAAPVTAPVATPVATPTSAATPVSTPVAAPTATIGAWTGPVKVLDGGKGDHPAETCVTDPSTTAVGGATIAAQCCEPSVLEADGSPTCRRYLGNTNNDAGCIAGKPPRPHTFEEAHAACAEADLVMCEQSCSGKGCNYNPQPVWTKLSCPTPTSTPHPTPNPVGGGSVYGRRVEAYGDAADGGS